MASMAQGAGNQLSVVLKKKGELVLEDTPIPQPGKNEVQIQMQVVGICGSDIHFWETGGSHYIVKKPLNLGHEGSGIVSAVGEGVKHLKVGDRVAIEPGVPCRMCKYCKRGRYNLCPDLALSGVPPTHGHLRRYYCHAADFCYKLPDNVSLEEGAILEPLSVAVNACRRAGVALGSLVLVCGAGPIGLLTLLTAKAMGAAEVAITDLEQNRLDMAKKLGVDYPLRVDTPDPQVMAKKIEEAFGEQPDITIECSGAEASIQTGIYATASGGCLTIVGAGAPTKNLPIVNATVREVDIRGLFIYPNCYPTALAMIASGKVDPKPIITHHFPLAKSIEAFETFKTGAGGAIKVMIHCNE